MRSGILPGHRDEAVRPQDDLFGHANGSWVRDTEIPADRGRYGTFDMLREQSDERVRTIIERAAADSERRPRARPPARSATSTARSWTRHGPRSWASRRSQRTWPPSRGSGGLDELFQTLGRLQREGGPGLFDFGVAPDAKNPEEYVLYLGQGGLGLPDESYYREERHAAILAAYLPARGADARVRGDRRRGHRRGLPGRARGGARDAAGRPPLGQRRHPRRGGELQPLRLRRAGGARPNVRWDAFVDGLDAREAFEHVVVGQPSYLEGLSGALDEVIIEDFRHWLAFHVVASAAPLLTRELVDAEFDFTGRVISGLPENRERWKRGVSLVEGSIGEAVGQLYAAEYFPPEAKERMLELVGNLVEAYRRSFEGLDWMGPQTREQALAKLASFTPKVGYPDRWRDYSALAIDDDLVGNVRRANEFELEPAAGQAGRPDRPRRVADAAADGQRLLPPADERDRLPGRHPAAAVLRPGRRRRGQLRRDRRGDRPRDRPRVRRPGLALRRHRRAARLVDRGGPRPVRRAHPGADRPVQQLSPIAAPDEKVNGALTVGENIGDLGGLAIGYSAYRIATEGQAAPELDGYTGRSGSSSAGRRSGPARRGPRRPSGCSRSTRTPPPRCAPTRSATATSSTRRSASPRATACGWTPRSGCTSSDPAGSAARRPEPVERVRTPRCGA